MQRGNLEVGLISPQDVAEQIPEYSIFTAGYLIHDRDHLEQHLLRRQSATRCSPRSPTTWACSRSARSIMASATSCCASPRRSDTPADLAGMKLRVPGSESWRSSAGRLVAIPTPIAFDEVYLALKTGTVDAVEQPLADVISAKFYEVTEQLVLTGHLVSTIFFAFAKPFWDSLSDEEKRPGPGRGRRCDRVQQRWHQRYRGRAQ